MLRVINIKRKEPAMFLDDMTKKRLTGAHKFSFEELYSRTRPIKEMEVPKIKEFLFGRYEHNCL